MDDVTQQNAALVEQAAAAAEAMQEQTENLTVMAGQFRIDNKSRSNPINKSYNPPKPIQLETYKSSSQPSQNIVVDNSEWEEF
jgi:methyl-accepting chemotaxis protein